MPDMQPVTVAGIGTITLVNRHYIDTKYHNQPTQYGKLTFHFVPDAEIDNVVTLDQVQTELVNTMGSLKRSRSVILHDAGKLDSTGTCRITCTIDLDGVDEEKAPGYIDQAAHDLLDSIKRHFTKSTTSTEAPSKARQRDNSSKPARRAPHQVAASRR